MSNGVIIRHVQHFLFIDLYNRLTGIVYQRFLTKIFLQFASPGSLLLHSSTDRVRPPEQSGYLTIRYDISVRYASYDVINLNTKWVQYLTLRHVAYVIVLWFGVTLLQDKPVYFPPHQGLLC